MEHGSSDENEKQMQLAMGSDDLHKIISWPAAAQSNCC